MENQQDEGVKPQEENLDPKPEDNKNDQPASEGEKTPGEGDLGEDKKPTADDLLKDDKRILVDKDRFNDRNDKAKIYEAFAPIIDKLKDDPEAVRKLLEVDKKGSLEERVAQMEEERRAVKQAEIKNAVNEALSKWEDFHKDWPEIKEQVGLLSRRGIPFADAIRRSYFAYKPELVQAEARDFAKEGFNAGGQFQSGGGMAPKIKSDDKDAPKLNEREVIVAQSLLGKDFGGGKVLVKSQEDYARLLEKHRDHLKSTGFYDLP